MAKGLRISEAASIAAHALALLSEKRGERLTTDQIASQIDVSAHHLAKVLHRLSRVGFVTATRGRGGGFSLTTAGRSASLLEVIESIDGALTPEQPVIAVPAPEEAGARALFATVQDRLIQGLSSVTVGEARRAFAEERLGTPPGAALPSAGDWRMVLDSVHDAVIVYDTDTWEIADVNRQFCEMFGYTTGEARRLSLGDLSSGRPPYTQENALAWMRKAVEEGPQAYEWQAKKADGELLWVEVSLQPMTLGNRDSIVAIVTDITERKEAEEALRGAKKFSAGLIAAMQDGFSVLDRRGGHIQVNPALCQMTGFSREELIGVGPPHPYWAPEGLQEIQEAFEKTLRCELDSFELTFMRKSGERFPVIVSPSFLSDEQGNVVSYFATVKDITERKASEEALRESEERYRDLYEEAPNAFFSVGVDGIIKSANRRAAELTGLPLDELIGSRVIDLYADTPSGKPPAKEAFQRFKVGEEIAGEELEMRKADGTILWIRLFVRPIRDAGGNVVQSRSVVTDITERKLAEDTLRAEKDKFEGIVASLRSGLDIVSPDYRIHFQNKVLKDRFGDLSGKLCYEEYMAREAPCEPCPMEMAMATGSPQTVEMTGADGRAYEITSTPFRDTDGETKVIEVVRDITERKRAEEALRESEERFRQIAENVEDAFWLGGAGESRGIFYVNPAFEKVWGRKPEEVYEDDGVLWESLHEDDREKFRRVFEEYTQSGKGFDVEFRIVRPDGEVRWLHARGFAIRDDSGKVYRTAGVVHDITERKEAKDQAGRMT